MKVILFSLGPDCKPQEEGYFTAIDGKVVFFDAGSEEPIPEERFIWSFGEDFPVFDKMLGMFKVSYTDPENYLKYIHTRYYGHSWTEVEKDYGIYERRDYS